MSPLSLTYKFNKIKEKKKKILLFYAFIGPSAQSPLLFSHCIKLLLKSPVL
jgi:hypothetical protein